MDFTTEKISGPPSAMQATLSANFLLRKFRQYEGYTTSTFSASSFIAFSQSNSFLNSFVIISFNSF